MRRMNAASLWQPPQIAGDLGVRRMRLEPVGLRVRADGRIARVALVAADAADAVVAMHASRALLRGRAQLRVGERRVAARARVRRVASATATLASAGPRCSGVGAAASARGRANGRSPTRATRTPARRAREEG